MEEYFYVELLREIKAFKNKYGNEHTLMKYEDYVLKLNEPNLSYNFVKLVEGANIIRHQLVVVINGSSRIIYEFARDIEGADIDGLYRVVEGLEDEYYIKAFKTNIIDRRKEQQTNKVVRQIGVRK